MNRRLNGILIGLLAIHGVLSPLASNGAVNVLTLGVKNDGSEDVSAIVNVATEKDALFFPAGIYKVAKPLWLKHPISGEGYLRSGRIEPSRTCFVSDIVCTNGSCGVINFTGDVQINVEKIAIKCRSTESGIRIAGCEQGTYTFISQVGIFGLRATGVMVDGWGSRPIFVENLTVHGTKDYPAASTGVAIGGAADCRLSNVEIMGTRIGLDLRNGHTYGSNLHVWTGCMSGKDNGTWWDGTRGIVLGPQANFAASQVYLDTSYYVIEQKGRGGCCEIANLMYWEDESIRSATPKTGVFYHREPDSTAKLVINGGMFGVAGTDACPGWLKTLYTPEADIRDVIVLSDYAITTNNLDRICFGQNLPDYQVRYAEKGWFKAVDILAAAPTGACEGALTLGDGAAWKVACVKTAGKEPETTFTPLNDICSSHQVRAAEKDGVVRILVFNSGADELKVRFTTAYMGERFRPLDHGTLRSHKRESRCHEVVAQ